MSHPSIGHEFAKAVLVDKATNERLEFQYNPNEIKDSIADGWAEGKVPGSTHPRMQYAAGGGRSWEFKLKFYREGDGTADYDVEEVSKKCRWLQSCLYPEYNANGSLRSAPHICIFTWGTLFHAQVLVRKADVRYMTLFEPKTLQPILAEVDVKLSEWLESGRTYTEIRGGSGTGEAV